jgi:orotate phosphoribosyltransferase
LTEDVISRIQQIAEERGALRYGEFKLSAGGTSSYYFDGRLLTLDSEGGYLVAKALLPLVLASGAEAIAGPTLGADPIVASVATVSHIEGTPVNALIVRGQAKGHGTARRVEGSVREGMKVAVVDDTCTSGRSLFLAIEALEEAGCEVVVALCVLDRNEGGSAEVARRGYPFQALLSADSNGKVGPA